MHSVRSVRIALLLKQNVCHHLTCNSIYYHFCLLVLFQPFLGLAEDDSLIRPSEICAQSALSVLSLAQSYESLFTLRRVSGFVPYFVLTTGLFSRTSADASSSLETRYVRISGRTLPRSNSDPSGEVKMYGQYKTSCFSSHLRISAVDHARLLLEKMNSDHLSQIMSKKELKNAHPDLNVQALS